MGGARLLKTYLAKELVASVHDRAVAVGAQEREQREGTSGLLDGHVEAAPRH